MGTWITTPGTTFLDRSLPAPAKPAGYAALIARYDLDLPTPPRLVGILERRNPRREASNWLLLPPPYAPSDTLEGHLTFALKHEGIDLAVLSALFEAIHPRELATIIQATPTGAYARRLWFLYEWLTGARLGAPDTPRGVRAVLAVDPRIQIGRDDGELSLRHRVIDNLPGTPAFCPMVRRTSVLDAYSTRDLAEAAGEVAGRTHPDLMARAAAFLLLADSNASFSIEGERPGSNRAARWARIIGEAGKVTLSISELERLQRMVIDSRFVKLGLRKDGGFVGAHDRRTGEPLPEHISARAEDLQSLVQGVVDYVDKAVAGGVDPVIAAAVAGFGFVYIHPFEDGNGRVHRWLFHHVLAAGGFSREHLVFPVSAAILRSIDAYRGVLRSYSAPLLPHIHWRATKDNNVEALGETARFYRYFDATAHAEYLYSRVAETIERDLPEEVAYLEAFDRFSTRVQRITDLPDRVTDLLARFLEHGGGKLSGRARAREFAGLTDEEAAEIEEAFAETIGALKSAAPPPADAGENPGG